MIETIVSNFSSIRPRDVIDILAIAFIIYQGLALIKGTRAFQMAIGVMIVMFLYYVTRLLDLRTVQWLLENLFPYFVFALIVVFQSEIRRALAEIGKGRLFRAGKAARHPRFEEIVLAATTLSSQRIGALVVVEGQIGLKNYIESGIKLDAHLTYDLLLTIFNPKSPLHDGAVIVTGNRITAAGCFLPLTTDPYLSKELGTRHRAAIGMTEETDAVAVVVSEETGKISAVFGGEITRSLDGPRLMKFLEKALEPAPPKTKLAPGDRTGRSERQTEAI